MLKNLGKKRKKRREANFFISSFKVSSIIIIHRNIKKDEISREGKEALKMCFTKLSA
jgi:hypothetical protein